MISELGLVAGAFTIVTASPGPANLAVTVVSMAQGMTAGIRMAIGLALGLSVWGLIAALGLGAIFAAAPGAQVVLKVAGGSYLLWLSLLAAKGATRSGSIDASQGVVARHFRAGLILNLLNPKAVLAWMAVLATGLDADGNAAFLWSATALCCGIGLLNYLAWSVVFSRGWAIRVYSRARRWIDGATAALFAVAGLGLLRSAMTR